MFIKVLLFLFVMFLLVSQVKSEPYFNHDGSVVFSKENSDKPAKKRYNKKHKSNKNTSNNVVFKSETVKSNANDAFVVFRGHRMPKSVSEKLIEVEKMFGKIEIISSCRPGATVKKTNRPSMHRYCRAIDFNPRKGSYNAVASYLKRTWKGGVGTYSGYFNHIHIDNNRGRWHN